MKLAKKIILIIAILIFLLITFVYSLGFILCNNTAVKEVCSPNREYKVVVFERNCGATTGFSTQVSVFRNSILSLSFFKKSGNVFIADTNHGEAQAAEWGGPEVEVEWLNNNKLLLKYPKQARVFKSEKNKYEIKIVYKFISN